MAGFWGLMFQLCVMQLSAAACMQGSDWQHNKGHCHPSWRSHTAEPCLGDHQGLCSELPPQQVPELP